MSLTYNFSIQILCDEGKIDPENVREIRIWLELGSFPHLPVETIALFLLSCGNDVATTKEVIRNHFKIKTRSPEIFRDRDVDGEGLKQAKKLSASIALPKRLNNSVIICSKLLDTDHQNFVLGNAFKLFTMAVDVSQQDSPPLDLISIIDMEGVGLMHLGRVKLSVMKNFIDYIQDGMPLKINKIHILNVGYIAEKVLAISRLFMNAELAEAMVVHRTSFNMEEFHQKWVPAGYLPREYGGSLPSFLDLNRSFLQSLQEMKGFFQADEELITSYSGQGSSLHK